MQSLDLPAILHNNKHMYTVIKLSPNHKQTVLGKFLDHDDASLFSSAKYQWDATLKTVQSIYKVIDESDTSPLPFQIELQYPGKMRQPLASFNSKADAKQFLQTRIEWDEQQKNAKMIYFLRHAGVDVESQTWDQASANQNQLTQTFSPTPMPKSPRPPGTPPIIWDDEDED